MHTGSSTIALLPPCVLSLRPPEPRRAGAPPGRVPKNGPAAARARPRGVAQQRRGTAGGAVHGEVKAAGLGPSGGGAPAASARRPGARPDLARLQLEQDFLVRGMVRVRAARLDLVRLQLVHGLGVRLVHDARGGAADVVRGKAAQAAAPARLPLHMALLAAARARLLARREGCAAAQARVSGASTPRAPH